MEKMCRGMRRNKMERLWIIKKENLSGIGMPEETPAGLLQ
jgi:hypothetical protein